jgi:hypothetical protein
MKTTLSPQADTGAKQISCVKISRTQRGLHASPQCETADLLAEFTGIGIAKGGLMKTTIRNLLAAMLVAASFQTHAQGFVYDQQSANGLISTFNNGVDGFYIQTEPLTQSFIPSLSAIGFVQFEFIDPPGNGNNGATVYVNLWTGSPNINSATLLGSTTPVYMPNGFMNNNLGLAGVTNFYFSTPVALTAGQTYYLQPEVLSGDNPWAIVVLTNTYPNGLLYGSGSAEQPGSDLWFREGIETTPEPSTLALIGVSSLLVFIFKRRSKLVALLLFTAPVLPVYSAPDSVVQATSDAAGLTPVSAAALPNTGTFWIMTVNPNGNLVALPYPFLPPSLSALPIFAAGNAFVVDDTGGQLAPASAGRMSDARASSIAQRQSQSMADLLEQILNPPFPGGGGGGTNEEYQPRYTPLSFDTNGLWLEATNEAPNLGLRLHNPVGGDNYQLLSTTNLLNTPWDLGQILFGVSGDYVDFSPVPMTNVATFFRAHQANPVMGIYNSQNSEELNPTNTGNTGYAGSIYIYEEGSATNDVTVYYSIGGTAQNGIDYSNLTGEVTVSNSQNEAEIDIDPTADGLKPDQTVILTLTQNTNYLIDPAYYSATNILYANPEVYPIAHGDIETPCPNTSWNVQLNANDPQGLPLTYTILTWPTHGTLITNDIPTVYYTATNCYEGQDSFTFKVNDGEFDSAPATVTLIIADPVYASSPTSQTCRGAAVSFSLGYDGCSETLSYGLLSTPAHGTLSGTAANLTYTSSGTNFTGTDNFDYIIYSGCGGDSATGTVAVTIGDAILSPKAQSVMTGTNQPVAITLSAADYDSCNADTNYYTYTVTSSPTNGTLTGTPPNLTYTPATGFEGMDSFQFTASDGVWTAGSPATVTLYVVAGPVLTAVSDTCYPFGSGVQLDWSMDTTVSNMWQQNLSLAEFFIVSRATNSSGPYTPIYTNDFYETEQLSYEDGNAVPGQTNYYTVTFEPDESFASVTYESPASKVAGVLAQNSDDFIPANAFWNVVTNLSFPTNVIRLQAPFSNQYPGQYANLLPLPNTNWPSLTMWSNSITLYIPTNTDLSQVQYSIAIDNDYWLYLNNSPGPIDSTNHSGFAAWPPLKSFNSVAPGVLHYGTNSLRVVIQDDAGIDYFSMVVTTNTCGWPIPSM